MLNGAVRSDRSSFLFSKRVLQLAARRQKRLKKVRSHRTYHGAHRDRRGLGRARRTWNPPNRGMVAQNRLAEQRSSSGNERSSQSSASELPPAFRNHRGALSVSQLRLSSGSKSQRANAASPGPRNNASRRFQIGLARSCRCRESRIRTTSKSASVIVALFSTKSERSDTMFVI